MNFPDIPRMDRRTAIKWMATVAAASVAMPRQGLAVEANMTGANVTPEKVIPRGYGTDPDVMKFYKPGDVWPLTMTPEQRRTAAVLCAIIFPGDENTKNAAELNVHDFIDEWISAPYDQQIADRPLILEGLVSIDADAQRRYEKSFADLNEDEIVALCDDIRFEPEAAPEDKAAARFFSRFRDLAAAGFYSTPEGMRNIGYVGNVAMASFDGPPPEVIARLGLDE